MTSPATAPTWRKADLALPGRCPSVRRAHPLRSGCSGWCRRNEAVYSRNIEIARNVFDQAVGAGTRAVVFLSSMSAYGVVSVPEVKEDLPPGELDPYGRAKRESEDLLQSSTRRGLSSGLSIRLPGTVGKGSHGNFLSVALARILAGETIQAKNPDSLFNNIVYVGDLAAFLEEWIRNPRTGYGVTNLGAGDPLPMREVMSLLFQCAGREQTIVFADGGKKPFLISLDRAISLGYRPRSVKASIESFVRDSLAGTSRT